MLKRIDLSVNDVAIGQVLTYTFLTALYVPPLCDVADGRSLQVYGKVMLVAIGKYGGVSEWSMKEG